MTATIRPATPADAEALAALKLATFRETFIEGFRIPYPAADLMIFEAGYAPDAVLAEISNPAHLTWIAEREGRMIGYAHTGPCKLPHPGVQPGACELYQLYLRKEAQGLGLGNRLLDLALDHIAQNHPGPIWIGVWSGNLKAQAVYARKGFAKAGEYDFPVGSWTDHEFIFRRD